MLTLAMQIAISVDLENRMYFICLNYLHYVETCHSGLKVSCNFQMAPETEAVLNESLSLAAQ